MKKIVKPLLALLVIVLAFSSCIVRERAYGPRYGQGYYAPGYYHEHRGHGHWY